MVKLIQNLVFAGFILMISAGAIYWTEAEKEIRVLCLMFQPGDSKEYVTTTLDTGNLLSYTHDADRLNVNSPYNLYSTSCSVEFSGSEMVSSRTYIGYFSLTGFFIWIAIFISIAFVILQSLLAMGFPLGEYAWGGKHRILPKKYRYGSLVSVLLFVFSMTLLLGYTYEFMYLPEFYPVYGVLFLMSAFANFNSESRKEKIIGIPSAILLYVCYLLLSIQ